LLLFTGASLLFLSSITILNTVLSTSRHYSHSEVW
jgi:hypothetical protein